VGLAHDDPLHRGKTHRVPRANRDASEDGVLYGFSRAPNHICLRANVSPRILRGVISREAASLSATPRLSLAAVEMTRGAEATIEGQTTV
jgi:hypothetical protein